MNQTIHTQSFNLATYIKGDTQSDKFALILPGLLDTKDYLHMTSHVDFLATKGYLALSFDPAGTWESLSDELIEYYKESIYRRQTKIINKRSKHLVTLWQQ